MVNNKSVLFDPELSHSYVICLKLHCVFTLCCLVFTCIIVRSVHLSIRIVYFCDRNKNIFIHEIIIYGFWGFTLTFTRHRLQQGLLSSTSPGHLSVSSPGLPWKGRGSKLIVLSVPCKQDMCGAAPSMFTVNGNLCRVCLLALSHFNP